jgi:hypothetical protein
MQSLRESLVRLTTDNGQQSVIFNVGPLGQRAAFDQLPDGAVKTLLTDNLKDSDMKLTIRLYKDEGNFERMEIKTMDREDNARTIRIAADKDRYLGLWPHAPEGTISEDMQAAFKILDTQSDLENLNNFFARLSQEEILFEFAKTAIATEIPMYAKKAEK